MSVHQKLIRFTSNWLKENGLRPKDVLRELTFYWDSFRRSTMGETLKNKEGQKKYISSQLVDEWGFPDLIEDVIKYRENNE